MSPPFPSRVSPLCLAVGLAAASVAGCAGTEDRALDPAGAAVASRPGELAVWPGQYAAAFDAARRTLRDYGFILDRVDAQAGVITAAPKGSGGLATPWDREQQTFADELEDVVQRHRRRVRVSFVAAEGSVGPEGSPAADLREFEGPLAMRIEVVLDRVQQPGWRLNSNDVLASTYTLDPMLAARVRAFPYAVASRQDVDLAERLAERMNERMLSGAVAEGAPGLSATRAPAAGPAGG